MHTRRSRTSLEKLMWRCLGAHARNLRGVALGGRLTLAQWRTGMARLNGYLPVSRQRLPSNTRAGRREKRWSIFFCNARNGMNSEKSYEHAREEDGDGLSFRLGEVSIRRPELETKQGRSSSDDIVYTCDRKFRQLTGK